MILLFSALLNIYLLIYSWCTVLCKLQVYSILWFTIFKGYTPFSYFKILAIFLVLYNISCSLLTVYTTVYTSLSPTLSRPSSIPLAIGCHKFVLCICVPCLFINAYYLFWECFTCLLKNTLYKALCFSPPIFIYPH